MPLGIDATLDVRLGAKRTARSTASQFKTDSPYNTRKHTGLPPTPIAAPGQASSRPRCTRPTATGSTTCSPTPTAATSSPSDYTSS